MKMNKKAIENAIKNNRSKVDGFVVSPDDAEYIKVIREVKQELVGGRESFNDDDLFHLATQIPMG